MSDFDAQVEKLIPAEVNMISGSHDAQTSADVFNVSQFQLPDPQGRAGGACTSAVLKVLYDNNAASEPLTWVTLLRRMRNVLGQMGFDQVPQLTSSRMIDVNKPMYIVPPSSSGSSGMKRAILIGINYTGQRGELSGCHNDVNNIAKYLENVHGFDPKNMLRLVDNGVDHAPTRANIMNAFTRIGDYSKAGDVVFLHYSGHGSRVPDRDGDEDDGYDETLVPVDFERNGQIVDDDILRLLVKPLAAGVTMTCLMDCCHSGTVLDLPYRFTADGDVWVRDEGFSGMLASPEVGLAICCCLALLADSF
mmetsp:Transcript_8045/g.12307  ORF Transcript_8045/g.12307 Transcript_8045/m.12307 type:complete len:306 (+) Transcript_8045:144-1061(+)|eukprot:CAMPEP_0178915302 /NCGR_PEP_ID=MMETSP0786-20121207/11949_1 /TAXON_ID=186022 /ORGANISM="Thalassionema frauenfeldii, Strain CCMP 1798" /LENGTH=305 /DNA_ID=CAMNT_0020588393 /DNA_START=84 /DNA_END=1001 /DNA_ORIENTATION=+